MTQKKPNSMDIRKQLLDELTAYVWKTLGYIETVRDFCGQEQKWSSKRKAETVKLSDISENQQEEKEKKDKLEAVLKDTLNGLEKLKVFLDAVEKLTVTSRHVFSEEIFMLRGQSPESVKSVIKDAGTDAHLLIHFKRKAKNFFCPIPDNVNVLVFQLDNYVVNTKQLCRRIRQSLIVPIDTHNCDQPLVELNVNLSKNIMSQMLHHLKQLSEIRENEHTRLAFLFQENAQKFIDVFSERSTRMCKALSDLEETAMYLDRMKMGSSISTVASSSVGLVGGVLTILGAGLAPFTAGASLSLSLVGASLGGASAVSTLVTGVTEMKVNSHHEQNAEKCLKSFTDDMKKIIECLNEAANRERPLVQPSSDDADKVTQNVGGVFKGSVEVLNVVAAVDKKEKSVIEFTTEGLENVLVATNLSRTGYLAKIGKLARAGSKVLNGLLIGMDGYYLVKESINLAEGSETEVSRVIRSKAVLWKSELKAWEKIHDSLSIGIKTISETNDTLEKPFLP